MYLERNEFAIYFNYRWFQNTSRDNKNAYVQQTGKDISSRNDTRKADEKKLLGISPVAN